MSHEPSPLVVVGNEAITAELIESSINRYTGEQLITIKTVAPKFLDGEIRAHRAWSQNSSSSRAIPVSRTLERGVYIPTDVRMQEPGMQGYTNLNSKDTHSFRTELFKRALGMVMLADKYADDIHKQHLNRYLEPWTLQTKVITGGLWSFEHFLGLRLESDADPAIQALAQAIQKIFNGDTFLEDAKALGYDNPRDAHLPFILPGERQLGTHDMYSLQMASAARCARVSYNNHDGKAANFDADLRLADQLLTGRHASPFEHTAMPSIDKQDPLAANFPGSWKQFRQTHGDL